MTTDQLTELIMKWEALFNVARLIGGKVTDGGKALWRGLEAAIRAFHGNLSEPERQAILAGVRVRLKSVIDLLQSDLDAAEGPSSKT